MTEVYVSSSQARTTIGLGVVVLFDHSFGTKHSLSKYGCYQKVDQTQTLPTVCLKLFAEMSCQCDICQKTFSSFRSLRRHRKAIHNIKTQNKPLQCNDCNFESPSLVGMIQHSKQLHGSETIHHCVYCSETFLLKSVFEDHMKLNHGMPQWRNSGYSGDLPVVSSISGDLRSIQLHTSGNENDMLEYLMNQKHEIQQIIRSETEAGPKKIQFAAKIKMMKDVSEQEEPEHFDFFINSEMTIVYPGENLTDEMFWNKAEQIINSISTITTNGSGWRFEKLAVIRNKIVKVLPNSCWLLHCFASEVPIRAIATEHQELQGSELLSVLLHGCFPLILWTPTRERRHLGAQSEVLLYTDQKTQGLINRMVITRCQCLWTKSVYSRTKTMSK